MESQEQPIRYAELIQKSLDAGLRELTVELIQVGCEENGHTTIARATAVMKNGRSFTDFGDASPLSVLDWKLIPHRIRIASTRAKARVLRDALGIGACVLEEMTIGNRLTNVKPFDGPLTARQLEALNNLADKLGVTDDGRAELCKLTKITASNLISQWSQEANGKAI